MATLEQILFGEGDFNQKRSYIQDMTCDALMGIKREFVKRIIATCGDEYHRLFINSNRRVGNNWNSLVEGVAYTDDGYVWIEIYIQNTKTDTTESEFFETFFRKGEYFSKNNRLNVSVDYKESEKAEVMRSILLEAIFRLYDKEELKKKVVEKLSQNSIVNPILDKFYHKYGIRYCDISKHSRRDDIAKNKAYHGAEKEMRQYIMDNAYDLEGIGSEDLQRIYTDVFQRSFDRIVKEFDYQKWYETKGKYLWY